MEPTPFDPIIQSLESLLGAAPKGIDTSFFTRLLEDLRAKRTCRLLDIPDPEHAGPYEGYGNFETWAAAEWVRGVHEAREYWGSLAFELLSSDLEATAPGLSAQERAVGALAQRLREAHASRGRDRGEDAAPLFPMPDVDWDKIAFMLVDLADHESQQLD